MLNIETCLNREIKSNNGQLWLLIKCRNTYSLLICSNNGHVSAHDTVILSKQVEKILRDRVGSNAIFIDDNSSVFKADIKPGQKYRYHGMAGPTFTVISNLDKTFSIINEGYEVQHGCNNLTQQEINSKLYNDRVDILN